MPTPVEITLHRQSRCIDVLFDDGARFSLRCAYLRHHSPAAGEPPHQSEEVTVTNIEPVGNYAVRLVFSDGHDSGLYTWDLLYQLGVRQAAEQETL